MGCELIFTIPLTYVDTLQSTMVGRQRHPCVLGFTFWVWVSRMAKEYTKVAHTRADVSKTYPAFKCTYLHSQAELDGKLGI